jgi:hypothetical protein
MRLLSMMRAPGIAIAAAGCIAPGAVSASDPIETGLAEYAIRWHARDGGPRTLEEALAVLHARMRPTSTFTVEYYDLPSNARSPAGYSTIVRRRVAVSGRAELTWKMRGEHALPEWSCPLRNSVRAKSEVDVTLGSGDETSRRYSYSCTSEEPDVAAAELSATRKSCSATMRRWERGGLKVEEWHLAGNVVLIEVSRGGADTKAALADFRRRVAAPLNAAGIAVAADSKSELGSHC